MLLPATGVGCTTGPDGPGGGGSAKFPPSPCAGGGGAYGLSGVGVGLTGAGDGGGGAIDSGVLPTQPTNITAVSQGPRILRQYRHFAPMNTAPRTRVARS